MKVAFKDKEFIINGEPTMIMAGEIHYYRLHPEDWQDRITKMKNAGFNAIATYIPWVIHEQLEGDFDFTGRYKPQYNLRLFLEMCLENDLYLFVRPGPFVMAEMVGDGIPPWLEAKHPELAANTWDNKKRSTVTLDYLAKPFLDASFKWYDAVTQEFTKYIDKNLISIQIDNEIGMLSWVSNNPDFTDVVVSDMCNFIKDRHEENLYDFSLEDTATAKAKFMSPTEDISLNFHNHLGLYNRERHIKFINILKDKLDSLGFESVLYAINVHGTGGGKIYGYPIGLSQLYKSYIDEERIFSGSDLYFGTLTLPLLQDIYMSNALTDAVNGKDQPLTTLEYNSVDGNFGNNYGERYLASTTSLKTRLMLSQNNKMFNFYIFTGGFNDKMNYSLGNRSDLVATTGGLHGYGCPVLPNGKLNYIYNKTKEVVTLTTNLSKYLSAAKQDVDDIAVAFIPDYFMTEYNYPSSPKAKERLSNLERNRGLHTYEVVVRYMLMRGYQPSAFNIQDNKFTMDNFKLLILPSARYMAAEVQQKVAEYISSGGKVLIHGEIPEYDMCGNDCTILKDSLQITIKGYVSADYSNDRLLIEPVGIVSSVEKSFHDRAQDITTKLDHQVIIKHYDRTTQSGLIIDDNVVIITNDYRCDMQFFDNIFKYLNISSKIKIKCDGIGVYVSAAKSQYGDLITVLNLDDVPRTMNLNYHGEYIFTEDFTLLGLEGLLLPYNLQVGDVRIVKSIAELYNYSDKSLTFRLGTDKVYIELETDKTLKSDDENVVISSQNGKHKIVMSDRYYSQEYITINLI